MQSKSIVQIFPLSKCFIYIRFGEVMLYFESVRFHSFLLSMVHRSDVASAPAMYRHLNSAHINCWRGILFFRRCHCLSLSTMRCCTFAMFSDVRNLLGPERVKLCVRCAKRLPVWSRHVVPRCQSGFNQMSSLLINIVSQFTAEVRTPVY